MAVHLARISDFLNRPGIEGPRQLRGYVPCTKQGGGSANYRGPESGNPADFLAMGVSGVTVATGVDLGQTDAAALSGSGVDAGIVNMLRPYLGLRKERAVNKLHVLPLTVSADTAHDLDRAVHGFHARIISARYDRDKPAVPFAELPWQAQAVIFSLLFQRGTGAAGKAPHTWAALVAGNWRDAARRFRDASLWEGYHARRRLEGELLQELV